MTLTPSARGRSSEFRNDHDLYVSSALSSPCADVNLLDVGHPMFNSEASLKHLVRHQRIRTSGNLSKRPAGTREQRWCVLPMWMTWWTFWMVLVCITAILAVSLVNILSTKNLLDLEHKESVLGLAQVYASETSRQLRSSGSSLQALEAFLKVDAQHLALRSFDGLAHPLISTYQGITSLGLAPHGRVERVYPAGPFHVQNLSILLHPDLAAPAMKAMQRGEVQMSTWTPDGHDRAIMICRPIFTSYAPPVFQDGLMVDVNDTRHCSNTSSGVPACFWGFAIMMSTFDDLLRTNESLQLGWTLEDGGVFQLGDRCASGSGVLELRLSLVVEASVEVPELGVHWILELCPVNGWQIARTSEWLNLLLVLPITAMLSIGLGINVLFTLRANARQLEKSLAYRKEVRVQAISASISTLEVFQFPLCLVNVRDFLTFGHLVPFEACREQLRSLDSCEQAQQLQRQEGVVFISHQWVSFGRPDPVGVQYHAMVTAIQQLQQKGLQCNWLWVDYCCVPQQNRIQQQSAVNSISAYTRCCSMFLSVAPLCYHTDTGVLMDESSYGHRSWCRLERLCYVTCRPFTECKLWRYTDHLQEERPGDCDWDDLEVMTGVTACCENDHPGELCDKQRMMGLMLGIYWRLLSLRDDPLHGGEAKELLRLIHANEEKYFPSTIQLGDDEIQLFEGFLPVLRELFEDERYEEVKSQGLKNSCSLAPVKDQGATTSRALAWATSASTSAALFKHRTNSGLFSM